MLTLNEGTRIKDQVINEISGNRRTKQRFVIDRPMTYKLVKNDLVTGTGTGETVDMSSGGIAFTASETFRVGSHIELSVSWPVLLNGDCAMKLVVEGRVVRSTNQLTAIRMDRHEFRTQGRSQMQPVTTTVNLVCKEQSVNARLEFEKIAGELDAAIVFAAAAEEQYRNGQSEFGDGCRFDADGCHAVAVERMSKAFITVDQRQTLMAKLDHLEQCIDRFPSITLSTKNEAA